MINQFVTYDIAVKLKELGFDEPCFGGFTIHKEFWYPAATYRNSTQNPRTYGKTKPQNSHIIKAPTWDEAIEWFGKKGLYISIQPEFYTTGINWCWQILWHLPKEQWDEYTISGGTFSYGDNNEYPTRRLANIGAIEKMIELFEKNGEQIIISQ